MNYKIKELKFKKKKNQSQDTYTQQKSLHNKNTTRFILLKNRKKNDHK